jgi:hypothetical protein
MNTEIRGRTEIRTWTSSRRYNGTCKVCKRPHSLLRTFDVREERSTETIARPYRAERETTMGARAVECCGRSVMLKPVSGTRRADIVCGSKCTNSTGHVCECACGGRNHGAGHGTALTFSGDGTNE